jgi:NDP-sugar pyrophosphorylase family protein
MKALILSAGLGTRLKPFTDHHPKALAPVNGQPLLQRNIQYLQQQGIFDVVVNVHHFADQIIAALEENKGWGSRFEISDERDAVLETGGGLIKARPLLDGNESFAVMNADVLTDLDLRSMLQHHKTSGALSTLAVTNRTSSRHFLFDAQNRLCGWGNAATGEQKIRIEASSLQPKAFSGIHLIHPRIFNHIDREGKFSIVDVYLDLAASQPIYGFDHSDGKFIDVGKPESIAKAEQMFK